jgi:hypothetical protein
LVHEFLVLLLSLQVVDRLYDQRLGLLYLVLGLHHVHSYRVHLVLCGHLLHDLVLDMKISGHYVFEARWGPYKARVAWDHKHGAASIPSEGVLRLKFVVLLHFVHGVQHVAIELAIHVQVGKVYCVINIVLVRRNGKRILRVLQMRLLLKSLLLPLLLGRASRYVALAVMHLL